jgi:hypothetical protein
MTKDNDRPIKLLDVALWHLQLSTEHAGRAEFDAARHHRLQSDLCISSALSEAHSTPRAPRSRAPR